MTRYPGPGFAMRQRSPKEEARRKAASAAKAERRQWADTKGTRPARDPAYREWIAQQACIRPNCLCRIDAATSAVPYRLSRFLRRVECAHTGPHGIAQKASDYDCIPLCRWAHQEARDAQGKSRAWFEEHGLDRDAIIADLRRRYAEEQG